MSGELLQTKLYVPRLRPSLVPRPRLSEKLNQGLHGHLTLVCAPAGFGKTTLVTTWLSQLERPFAWVALDEDDNDVMRFFAYVVAAVQQVEGVGTAAQGLLQATQPVPGKSLAAALIHDCLPVATPFVLVLDDYHLIMETAVHEAVSFILDNLPPSLHLVITSRTDPLLPLPRLRARGQLTELRTRDLRFTAGEAVRFLRQIMGLNLSTEQVSALEFRTEGWIAGLQMAALSLQGLDDPVEIADFVNTFAGSHRYIFDYLTDEVLQQRPSDTQAFLLQTSLLDRFNAALCTAVTGQADSQDILQALDSANLFLFPLDEKREWYRYHHLFADLLRQRLHRRQPERVPELYQRASRWYAERGEVETAVHYALAGNDVTAATRLLDQVAADYVRRSEIAKLHKLLARLPAHASDSYPRLSVAQGWVYIFLGQYELAEKYASQAEASLQMPVDLSPDFPEALVRAQVATIRAYSANRQGRLTDAAAFSRAALSELDGLPHALAVQLRGSVLINLGQIQLTLDDVAQAEKSYRQAIAYSEAGGRFFGVMASYAGLLFLQRRLGQLAAAKVKIAQGLAWLKKQQGTRQVDYPAEGEFRQAIGEIYYAGNELDEARKHFQRGAMVSRHTVPARFTSCLHFLFLVALAQGELETAVQYHQQIESALDDFSAIPWVAAALRSERIVRLGRLGAAQPDWWIALNHWLTSPDSVYTTSFKLHQTKVDFRVALVLAALDRLDESLHLLNLLADAAETTGRVGDLIHCRVQQAVILDRLTQTETAVAHLTQAVSLAAEEGYVRVFLDEALVLQPLLRRLPATLFRDRLAELFDQQDQQKTDALSADQSQLVEPLSERELEVLRQLTSHLSGPQIARKLHISLNTFKSHTKNIYGKLGVRSRNTAVSRARKLGLL